VVVPPGRDGRLMEDAVHALVSIGYSDKEARKNVEQAASQVDEGDLEGLVRTALRQ
jgi:Holliday junction resolvasome RuvABC DNA-binding subunit